MNAQATIHKALRAFILEEHGFVEQYLVQLKALATEAAMDAEPRDDGNALNPDSLLSAVFASK